MNRLALTFLFLAASPAAADQLCETYDGMPTGGDATAGMVAIPGGTFIMGDADERPEERTPHEVTLSPFMIDRHEVTNAQFRAFVEATGYVTVAEAGLDPAQYPGLPPELLVPGGMVFDEPETADLGGNTNQWWRYVAGADWRHPAGPESSIEGLDNHPVVQVTHADALAYAEDGIRVNSVHPGFIWTPMLEAGAQVPGVAPEAVHSAMAKLHPLGTLGEPGDVAYGILYLASDEAKFVTGCELVIDGGYTAR